MYSRQPFPKVRVSDPVASEDVKPKLTEKDGGNTNEFLLCSVFNRQFVIFCITQLTFKLWTRSCWLTKGGLPSRSLSMSRSPTFICLNLVKAQLEHKDLTTRDDRFFRDVCIF